MFSFGAGSPGRSIKTILIVTFSIYLLQIIPYSRSFLLAWGALIPVNAFFDGQIWRFITYMFLHDPYYPLHFHILINMLMLWMFGNEIEELWGSTRFTVFYLVCGMGSGLLSFVSLFSQSASMIPVIGASGAVFGVMTMFAYYFPQRQVLLFFIIPVNIRILVIGAAVYSLINAFIPGGTISHLTHLGGILVAIGYIKLYPYISSWFHNIMGFYQERNSRKKRDAEIAKARYFENIVDPVLEKISREGMDSLTKQDKQVLKNAARFDRERMKKQRIIPFDSFR